MIKKEERILEVKEITINYPKIKEILGKKYCVDGEEVESLESRDGEDEFFEHQSLEIKIRIKKKEKKETK